MTLYNKEEIKYLVGNKDFTSKIKEPFEKNIINFLVFFSQEIEKNKKLRDYPDLKSLSFFCRKSNLLRLKEKFFKRDSFNRVGVGLVFHITPSNVPTNFVYSLIFGLLSGNSNFIKVPSKDYDQINIVCEILNKLLSKKFKKLKDMIRIVRYQDNDEFTKYISAKCDMRIVWGGDNTVNNLRNFKISPKAREITFPDRYSICLINTKNYLKLNEENKENLARKFYNDTYVLDQNACSSPHIIFWEGKSIKKAKEVFWQKLNSVVNLKYNLSEHTSVEKYTNFCQKIMLNDNIKNFKNYNSNIYTFTLKNLSENLPDYRGSWGMFFQFDGLKIDQLKRVVNSKFQTCTYFGFEKKWLKKNIIENKLSGIDRIVPIGQALDISMIWDGYDLTSSLTRVIELK